jgi:predicted permease
VNRESLARTFRSLRRSPGFVAIAALSLGTALGLSTAVFAFMDAMTHPASPYGHVDRLRYLFVGGRSKLWPSRAEMEGAWHQLSGVAQLATATWTYQDVEAGESVEHVDVAYTRPGLFELLELRPRLGRLPAAGDAALDNVAVVSDELWRRKFSNNRVLAGAKVSIADHQYTVVGVLPPRATLGYGGPDVWIPDPQPEQSGAGTTFLRLKPGVTDQDLAPQLKAITRRWTQLYNGPPPDRPFSAWTAQIRPDPLELKDFHRAMIGAAFCVLLIACANVAALMLARGMVRRRDYALRLALGAGRWEVAREVMAEVSALALVGCVAGAVVATWVVGLMTRSTPEEMRWLGFVQPQWSVRVFGLSALCVFASVGLAGAFPAWRASRTDPAGPLKEGSGGTTGRAGTRFRWLVIAELALAMTLMVGTTLMVKSAVKMARYDFGYDARGLLSAQVLFWWRDSLPPGERERRFNDALVRVRALPGVRDAALISSCSADHDVVVTDRTVEGGPQALLPLGHGCTNTSPGFFSTLGIPITEGRDFSEGDEVAGAAVLDAKTAKRLFPHERAVGRLLKMGDLRSSKPWMPIVGVVRDQELGFNHFPEMGPDSGSVVYVSLPKATRPTGDIIIRPAPGAKEVPVEVSRALKATLPPHSWSRIDSWVSSYEQDLRAEKFLSLIFLLLGVASLGLGAAGLFSVISYIASQRMREFAVRIALGATRDNVLRLVMRDALVMALGGTGIGAGFGMWAAFLLWDKMWGVYPVDAAALVVSEAILIGVTLASCLAPAMRAMRADPVEVLRAM